MITFNTQGTSMPNLVEAEVSAWVKSTANTYNKVVGDINYIFVDDETMLDINRRFIGHDYYTDHIGFDYSKDDSLSGDIYISLDTVKTNTEKFEATFDEELRRVIIHGLLHLCGFRDKTEEERQQMKLAEDEALKVL